MGPLRQSLVENILLQRCNCNIFGLTDTVALFAKEAGFFRFRVFFRASYLQNEVGENLQKKIDVRKFWRECP